MRTIDVIVVPSSRPSRSIVNAIKLAQIASVQMLVLCSKTSRAIEVAKLMSDYGVNGLAVDIPIGYNHPLISDYATAAHPLATSGREGVDTYIKRNISLLLARIVGWDKLAFLDDDIVGLESNFVQEAALALELQPIAGHIYLDFPDNSVVRHAQRLSGTEPGVFMSAGSLSIKSSEVTGFFPNIYNEDWFFLLENKAAYLLSGTPTQIKYDPFSHPDRASSEEFGDIVAEGVAALSAAGLQLTSSTLSDWGNFLAQRKAMILGIRKVLAARPNSRARRATVSLDSSLRKLDGILAADCLQYISLWRSDVVKWQYSLESLPKVSTIDTALSLFGLNWVRSTPMPSDRHSIISEKPISDPAL